MLRTPKSHPKTGSGVCAADTFAVFKAARNYFVLTGECDYDADRLAKVAVKQLRIATHRERDKTFILSRANLEFIASSGDVL